MSVLGGIPFSEAGALQVQLRPDTGVPAGEPVNGGWAVASSLNSAYFQDAGAAVPATAVKLGGIAFTPDGAIYLTQDGSSGTFASIGGHKVRSDGALLVIQGTPTPGTNPSIGGWAHDGATRAAYVGGDGVSFVVPFRDLGAGVVDVAPAIGTGSATFTRATSAWTVLSDGTIGLVASGSARSYYSPAGVYLGYLAEGARTNLCQRGEDFSAVWAAVGTPTLSAGTTTLGALSLSTIGDDSAAALEGYTQTIAFTGDAVKAIAAYVKQGTATSSVIRIRDETGSVDRLLAAITWSGTVPVVTMTTGTDLTGTPQQHAASGVYRLFFATTSVTAASTNSLQIYPASDSVLDVTATGTIQIGGVQAEDATFPSMIIRTPGSATVTKNSDDLTYPTSSFLNASAGTLLCRYTPFSVDTAISKWAVALDDGTANEMILLGLVAGAATGNAQITDGGVTQGSLAMSALTAGTTTKMAMSWASNVLRAAKDGTLGTEDTSVTLPTVTTLNAGKRASTGYLHGAISSITYWNRTFPESGLVSLTT